MESTTKERVGSRLTARGWGALIFSALGLTLGRVFGLFEITILSICAIILPMLAFFSKWYLSKISASCAVNPIRVPCFKTATLTVTFQKPRKDFGFPIQTSLRDGILEDAEAITENTIAYKIETQERGPLRLGPLTLIASDPFGLVNSTKKTTAEATLLVHPVVLPVSLFTNITEFGKSSRGFSQEKEFYTLRDYEPGADTKDIHWKSSSRTGTLKLKQYESLEGEQLSISIFIDNRPFIDNQSEVSKEAFERMVSVAASMASSVEQMGGSVFIQTADGQTAFTNGYEIMDFLCLLNQADERAELLTNKTYGFLKRPNAHIALVLLGDLSETDKIQLAENKFSTSNIRFFYFSNELPMSYSSVSIPKDRPLETVLANL